MEASLLSKNNLGYRREVLHGNPFFEIVVCEWEAGSRSPIHGHGWSQCFILVQAGRFENRAEFGLKSEVTFAEAGQVIATPVGVEHEIRCLTASGRTLHVYVPKIDRKEPNLNFHAGTIESLRRDLAIGLGSEPARWREVEGLLEKIEAHSISTNTPRFMNQLFSGVLPEVLAASAISTRTRTTLATFEASPAFTAVELELIDRLGEKIGWPAQSRDGIVVPGGSAANFMAVHCARQRLFPDAKTMGCDNRALKIFVSDQAHYSMKKAAAALGLGTHAVIHVASDSQGRMIPGRLEEALGLARRQQEIPLLVCATAGTTVYGAFDPVDSLAEICARENVWLHVDAAWGGPALFSAGTRHLVQGVERADSFTFDAHKLFGAGLTCSFYLSRHPGLLAEANDVSGGGYIFHEEDPARDRGRLSWQCGRGAEALAFWALWKNVGSSGLGGFVDRLVVLREECQAWMAGQPRLEVVGDPAYLNLCVRVRPPVGEDPEWSVKVRERLKQNNFAFVNFSRNEKGSFLRMILAHPQLTLADLKEILAAALAVG